MGLFTLNDVLLENGTSKPIDIDNIGYVDAAFSEHSYVQDGYDFILETTRFFNEAEKVFYSKVMGSYGDEKIINESFGDFFNKIKDIIKKFIEWIKKIFKQFVAKLAALVSSDKYIKKHHNLLSKFDATDEFEFNGYTFTHVTDVTVPRANALDAFVGSGNDIFSTNATTADLGFVGTDTPADKINKTNDYLQKRIDTLNDSLEDFYDDFRGKVINQDGTKITSTEFAEELFKKFRSGDDRTSSITIDSAYVNEAYRRFDKYKETVKEIEKTQKAIIKDYEDLEKHLDKLIKFNKDQQNFTVGSGGVAGSYSADQIAKLGTLPTEANALKYDQVGFDKMNSWLKIQSSKVSQMCSIHTQAFSAKLEACKDCLSQDKKILYKAIQQVLKKKQ